MGLTGVVPDLLLAAALVLTGLAGLWLFFDPRFRPGRWRWFAWGAVSALSLCAPLILFGVFAWAMLPMAMWDSSAADYATARLILLAPGFIIGLSGAGLAVLATRSYRRSTSDSSAR